ncbi:MULTISPECIES: NAD(P)/FAD-dependent oxidoreductase [Streptomycetaceae]|uniref:Halogenase n=1 Tax=Streptantibioticus cattleyicolor (strain ATCC 35852 / DSM 46488 / JCM 4925 / NBRC 14057 / NRRL 8057) TaxID=1003195 RepID=F8JSR4_STREN|nr:MULTISPECIES: tryptophan 7-halogenase [Streptomycetaceae]AEW97969.1 halogenase [Streptantibioticus cattleyicolor NRRL 8057 = DSM 46488]MYS62371.1 halogenase [Streptomyces sp. SID5468]CCB78288.1 putative halogenase [Streptantibioticus cattleyicolor NRRL 8057 = DSM 46488]
MQDDQRVFDVAVIGGGIGGTMLGAILARHGVRVLLLEGSGHPRFAIGESTVPETTFGLRVLARRYDVPEIEHLATNSALRRNVSSNCGVKRNFGFVYHREGEPTRPKECTQYPTWGPPLGPDSHYFRQDVDAYMFRVAVEYGVTAYTHTLVDDVKFEEDGVTLVTREKGTFQASYVVDAGGMRAVLPERLGLRKEAPYRTRSRTIYTHMVNVLPFDTVGPPRKQHGMPSPFSEGTLHHLFEGGWFWVIPFDNHSGSTSGLCSVGLNLDMERYPRPAEVAPEEEFWQHVRRFPSVARQFANARAVRPYVATDRTQFFSDQVVGDRWCLMPHASDFIDPLFSSGLAVTVMALNALGHRLIDAVRKQDFATERFDYLQVWIKRMFAFYDDLVSCSYISFDDFELWNAWTRVWTLTTLYGTNGQNQAAVEFEKSQDPAVFAMLERAPYRGLQGADNPWVEQMFTRCRDTMLAYRAGELSREETVARLFHAMRESGLSPAVWGTLDPEDRCPARAFTMWPLMKLLVWGKFFAPRHVRGKYLTGGAGLVGREAVQAYAAELRHGSRLVNETVRDMWFNWNRDWARKPAPRTTGEPPR